MTDVFISYSRSIEAQARQVAETLAALGYAVWRDDQLPAHKAYTDVTEEHLRAAKAVLVIWTAEAVKSEWVRAEAEVARLGKTLVQLSLDGSTPPLPFNQIQCAEMNGWSGEETAPGWKKVLASIAALTGAGVGRPRARPAAAPRKLSICVLPFANISDDPQQEYFSDGISEDIITDLSRSKVFGIWRWSRQNSAFRYKGQHVDLPKVARELRCRPRPGRQRAQSGRPGADYCPTHRRRGGRPRLGRALRPRPHRHLRPAGRDQRGHRQGVEAEASASGETGDRAARDGERRGLRTLSDGPVSPANRQRWRSTAR